MVHTLPLGVFVCSFQGEIPGKSPSFLLGAPTALTHETRELHKLSSDREIPAFGTKRESRETHFAKMSADEVVRRSALSG